jgi:tRNA (uracil-5-)-methyltransferase
MSVVADSPSRSPPPKRVRAESPAAAPAAVDAAAPAAASTAAAPSSSKPAQNKGKNFQQGKGKRKRNRHILPDPYSSGDVLYRDVVDFLGKEYVDEIIAKGDSSEWDAPADLELMSVIELTAGVMTVSGKRQADRISELTVTGESLSMYEKDGKKWAIVVPFAHPGDKIRAKVFKHDRLCSMADMVEIVEYCDDLRGGEGDRRVNPEAGCKYFGEWCVSLDDWKPVKLYG